MKRVLLFSMIILLNINSKAQDDHLEPRGTYGVYESELFDYFTNDLFMLLQDLTDDTLARFIMAPDIEPEQAFYLRKEGDDYSIHVNGMDVNNLHGEMKNRKKVWYASYPVDRDFAMKLIKLYQVALDQTDYPGKEQISRDGTLCLFTARDTGGVVRYAEKWSPAKGPNVQELISISQALIDAHKIRDNTKLLKTIEERMDALTKEIARNAASNKLAGGPKNRLVDYYRIYSYLNESRDTIVSVKEGEILASGTARVVDSEKRVMEYYIKDANGLWKNMTTGEQNVEFKFGNKYRKELTAKERKNGKRITATKIEKRWIT